MSDTLSAEELLKRARDWSRGAGEVRADLEEAAERIAALESDLASARTALEEIARHPIDSVVYGRSDLGLPGHRGSPTVAREALAALTVSQPL